MIIPAILTSDKTDLLNQLSTLDNRELVNWVHIDIMDNKFIPYQSIRVDELLDIKTNLSLEAHLMVLNPETYCEPLKKSGFKRMIFHAESTTNHKAVIDKARECGLEIGVALNPETNFNTIEHIINLVDFVLFLSVRPGKQGQTFIDSVLEKIKAARLKYPKLVISIDGGVNKTNIDKILKEGVNNIVVGSGICKNHQSSDTCLVL